MKRETRQAKTNAGKRGRLADTRGHTRTYADLREPIRNLGDKKGLQRNSAKITRPYVGNRRQLAGHIRVLRMHFEDARHTVKKRYRSSQEPLNVETGQHTIMVLGCSRQALRLSKVKWQTSRVTTACKTILHHQRGMRMRASTPSQWYYQNNNCSEQFRGPQPLRNLGLQIPSSSLSR